MKLAVIVLLLAVSFVASERPYQGYSVLKYELTDRSQMKTITDLEVDVWSHDSNLVVGINDIMVSEAQKIELARHGIYHKGVMIADVEKHLASDRERVLKALSEPQADFFDAYHTYAEILAFYADLVSKYSSSASAELIKSIGQTIGKVDIPAITIGKTGPKIFIEGGQHAREWVGPATVAYLTNQILTNSTYADKVQFVIVPVTNIDGYIWTWASTSNRLWRKNRRLNAGGSYGVDLNRNWDDHWGGQGSSSTPTSDTYHGTGPFSEPETKAVSAFYLARSPFAGAIDYHSYSQLILRPYGWTTALPPNDAAAKKVGDGIRDAILATSKVQYTSEPSWQLYYTAGTAQDWYYSGGKTPLAYTIELRDTGTYGFQLPPAQIRPTGQENWAGFKVFVDYILANPSLWE